jgi:hypothetical protein
MSGVMSLATVWLPENDSAAISTTEMTPTRSPSLFSTGAPVISCSVRKAAAASTDISSLTVRISGFIRSPAVIGRIVSLYYAMVSRLHHADAPQ